MGGSDHSRSPDYRHCPSATYSFLKAWSTHGERKQACSRGWGGGGNQKAGGSLTVTYMFPLCTRRHIGGSDPSRVAARLLCWKNTGCFSWYPSPDFETTCICVDFQHNVIVITQQLTCIVTRSGWYWASLYVSLSLLTTRDVMGLGLGLVMI